MAKRFFDTEKFSDEWYRRLPLKYKVFWDYLLCRCDHAGIVKIDIDLASFFIGEKLEDDCVPRYFTGRLIQLKAFKYFIPKFISFQYGKLGDSKPHKAVLKRLKDEGIDLEVMAKETQTLTLSILPAYPIDTLKDKDQDKDQDKVKEKAKAKANTAKKNLPKTQTEENRNSVLFEIESPQLEEDMTISQKASNVLTIFNSLTFKNFRPVPGNMKHINARLNEGYALSDFRAVVEHKYSQWVNDPKMRTYIRPETVFGPKFDSYLSEATDTHLKDLEDIRLVQELFPGYSA